MNTSISDEAVRVAHGVHTHHYANSTDVTGIESMRAALEAVLPHLHHSKPEAVRLRDELRERALQDQIDALSVSQVCDKDQIARDAITIRNLRGKLASVQPSPAAQGDALAAINRVVEQLEDMERGCRIHPDYLDDARVAQAALAARQPVGQEPVVTPDMLSAANTYHSSPEYQSGEFSDDHTNAACYRAMAAAAPPSQAVDLGQLSDHNIATLRDMREHMAAGTLSLNDWSGFGTAALDAVLALIDSGKAVQS